MINNKADKIIKENFDPLKNRYKNNLESMKNSEFFFDYVHLLYQKFHKINANHGGSCIYSPDWIKNEKATISYINKKYIEKLGDLKKIEKRNITIALCFLYNKKEKIYPVYVSKHNKNLEKQVILLMISNREKREATSEGRGRLWNYLAGKKL